MHKVKMRLPCCIRHEKFVIATTSLQKCIRHKLHPKIGLHIHLLRGLDLTCFHTTNSSYLPYYILRVCITEVASFCKGLEAQTQELGSFRSSSSIPDGL